MSYRKATVVNCKKASVRKHPWRADFMEDIVGELKAGSVIDVDSSNKCYDWTDRVFYKTKHPYGWIHAGVISIGGES